MRAGGWALLVLALVSCTSGKAPRDESREPGSLTTHNKFPLLTFSKLLEIAKESPTVESVLEKVAKKYPEYMLSYTLVYDSLSLQEATFTEPRVIVFGPEANLFLLSMEILHGEADTRWKRWSSMRLPGTFCSVRLLSKAS